ncbi:hypothetical protein CGC58_03365 [Capnocytophaga stomatis]|uniref:Beta-carotene 15,15'-monooxygenase n=1 Tax=Capnocytophaga stomatis TaxID=1848904 RepID=A0A250FY18_9FLAO|nr:DUF6427 family protein [Capnocytophaga stomatis]ATA88847.1 hypothetical protein CGC58_03365 [Capnocytophaga stomatis]
MISTRFENKKSVNLLIIFFALFAGFCLYDFFIFEDAWNPSNLLTRAGSFLVLFVSVFFLNIIVQWNELTENNSYSIFFFGFFSTIFPNVYNDFSLCLSNLLVIIAIWRIMTLKTEENIPQKIFDASFLIVCAGLLHIWAFIFLLNIWISLLFYGSKKRKYWLIPFSAIFCIVILFSAGLLLLNIPFNLPEINKLWSADYKKMMYLPTFVSLVITSIMLLVSIIVYFFKSYYHRGSSQVIIQFLFVGLAVVFLSKEIIFIFAPLSILFALYTENIERAWIKETILWIFLIIPLAILLLHFISKSQIAGISQTWNNISFFI